MADKSNLQIESLGPGGNEIITTITNANPEATDIDLYSFAVALNSLTQNSFENAKRLDVTNLTGLLD